MFTGGASSDAWLVRCSPAFPASSKHYGELLGGVGSLAASMPSPDHLVTTELDDLLGHLQSAMGTGSCSVHVGDEEAPNAESRLRPRAAAPSIRPSTNRRHRDAADRVQRRV